MKILGRKDATISFGVLRQEPDVPLADIQPQPDDEVSAASLLQDTTSFQESRSGVSMENENGGRSSTDLTEESLLRSTRS